MKTATNRSSQNIKLFESQLSPVSSSNGREFYDKYNRRVLNVRKYISRYGTVDGKDNFYIKYGWVNGLDSDLGYALICIIKF